MTTPGCSAWGMGLPASDPCALSHLQQLSLGARAATRPCRHETEKKQGAGKANWGSLADEIK